MFAIEPLHNIPKISRCFSTVRLEAKTSFLRSIYHPHCKCCDSTKRDSTFEFGSIVKLKMNGIDERSYLDDLRSFRWALYHHRKSREIIKCMSRYYFKKYNFEHFAEEIIIAGYDLQNVSVIDLSFIDHQVQFTFANCAKKTLFSSIMTSEFTSTPYTHRIWLSKSCQAFANETIDYGL